MIRGRWVFADKAYRKDGRIGIGEFGIFCGILDEARAKQLSRKTARMGKEE